MAKWKVPTKGFDFEEEDLIKGNLILSIDQYLNDLEGEAKQFQSELSIIDEFRHPFILNQYMIEKNALAYKFLDKNKKMTSFITEKRASIINIFDMVNNEDDNSARLIELYFYHTSLGSNMKRFIRIISYTPTIEKGYLFLYETLYHEIKRSIDWYYCDDNSKIIKWTFFDNKELQGAGVELFWSLKYAFDKINVQDKPIRRAASILTNIITGNTPDTKEPIPPNKIQPFL